MATNRVRGIRQKLPPNVVIGRGPGGQTTTAPAQTLSLSQLINSEQQRGNMPLPPAGLPAIPDGDLLANTSGGTARPVGTTLSALLDYVLGSTEGEIIQRGASAWQVLAPGTNGQVLTSQGAAALNHWATPSTSAFNFRGAWGGFNSYAPFDVVTFNGSAYVAYANVSAPASGITLDGNASSNATTASATVSLTTADSNDIIVLVVQAASFAGLPVISTVSDGSSLTWTRRTSFNYTPPFPGANGYQTTEIWWAKAVSALSSDTITVAMTASNITNLTAFGLHGAASLSAPFDANVSLPATNSNGGPSPPSVSGVSTSIGTGDGFVIFNELTASAGGGFVTAPTGFTFLGQPHGGGTSAAVAYEHIVANLSSATITSGDTTNFWSAVGDCVDGGATPNTTPALDDGHWISQGAGASSAVFDVVFGSVPGTVLWRSPTGWVAAYAGSAGPEHHAFLGGV